MADAREYQLNDFARWIIRHKASQLIGKHGLIRDDYEDLVQEMTLDLLRRLPRFDPAKASNRTFISLVVDRKVATILRYHRQEKRNYRRKGPSIDEPIEHPDCDTRGDLLGQDAYDLPMGKHIRPEVERIDMRLDVSLALSGLPPDLKALAERLHTQSITEASRDLGVPRSTLYGARARLRRIFEDKGLRDYL